MNLFQMLLLSRLISIIRTIESFSYNLWSGTAIAVNYSSSQNLSTLLDLFFCVCILRHFAIPRSFKNVLKRPLNKTLNN